MIHTHSLYTIKIIDKDISKYVKKDLENDSVVFTTKKSDAMEFWVQQNTIDPNYIKIHCGSTGGQVLTVANKEMSALTYKDAAYKDLENQQFLIYKSANYKDHKSYTYTILYKDMYLGEDKDKLLIKRYNNKNKDNNKNQDKQEFVFESLDEKNNESPTKFLWDELKYDDNGIPELILGPTKILLESLNDAPESTDNDPEKEKQPNSGKKDTDDSKNAISKETISLGIEITNNDTQKQ
ncbi:hypothetical protein BDAP_001774 [Binucleata daphniae]